MYATGAILASIGLWILLGLISLLNSDIASFDWDGNIYRLNKPRLQFFFLLFCPLHYSEMMIWISMFL